MHSQTSAVTMCGATIVSNVIQLDERRRARSVARHAIGSGAATLRTLRMPTMDDHKRRYVMQLLDERPEVWSRLTTTEQCQLLTLWKTQQ